MGTYSGAVVKRFVPVNIAVHSQPKAIFGQVAYVTENIATVLCVNHPYLESCVLYAGSGIYLKYKHQPVLKEVI